MSEKKKSILVTAQVNDGKRVIRFETQAGLPFFALLKEKMLEAGIGFSLCNGTGICGKCRVRFLRNAPLPELLERKVLTAEELRQGIRLACMTRPTKDCEVEVLFGQETMVVTEFLGDSSENVQPKIPAANVKPVLVADVGTTTIAMALTDKITGKVLETYTTMNPQAVYGADVIARITAAKEQGADKLQNAVGQALCAGADALRRKAAGPKDIEDKGSHIIYVAANTVMSHFLAGSDAAGLGSAPFTPEFLDSREVQLDGNTFVLLPGISAFVGGDITAGLLSCGMLPKIEANKGTLFLDLGTNGEMALCNGEKIYCTAAAAGPAFEGKTGERRGSHMIHSLAELLRKDAMDATGLLLDISEGKKQGITQQEIRELQMAKAAVRTGIEVLLQRTGMKETQIQKVCLAGGFGYYIEVEDAVLTGLLPESFREKTVSVGNAALQGAMVYAKLMEEGRAEELEHILRKECVPVNLAEDAYFVENYVEQMNFHELRE